ncbi:MAG: glycosyltransferase family 2 protein [Gemmatimonadetes bacterium]|nr:glycosyltransferase family 2 protein [Gemmatimonadota bacterium]NNL31209.1 glycosyltransferase family 2 protein [Gemmatimonadota bacterium]
MTGGALADLGLAFLDGFNVVVIGYFVLLNGTYLWMTLLAFGALRRYALRMSSVDPDELMATAGLPPVTLIAPAYNEEPTCVESTRSLLTLRYPSYDILVVNDGSSDGTLQRMVDAFELEPAARAPVAQIGTATVRGIYRSTVHPNLWVIDKENGGKADALNTGINYCRHPLFCAMDADSLLEPEALTRIVRAFLEDATTVAAGGVIRIVNGCKVRSGIVEEVRLPRNLLARIQVLEYLRSFLSGRMGWDALDATLIISGAFGMFSRRHVVEIGGYLHDTVGEDMELVVRLHRHCRENGEKYRVAFVPDPVAWTECPEDLGVLGRQRDRWQRGLVESLWRNRVMIFNPKYGRIGMLAAPYYFFLEVLGPVIESLGYLTFVAALLLGRASTPYVLAFLAVAFALGISLSFAAVGLEELSFRRYPKMRDLATLLVMAVVENVGYRQLSIWWRLRGMISKLRGASAWGVMERKGFATDGDDP